MIRTKDVCTSKGVNPKTTKPTEMFGDLNIDKGALDRMEEELWVSRLRYLENAYFGSEERDRLSTTNALLELVYRVWVSSLPEANV